MSTDPNEDQRNGWETELLRRTGLQIDAIMRIARESGLDGWNDAARIFEFEDTLNKSAMDRDTAILAAAVCLNRAFCAPTSHPFTFDTEEDRDVLTVLSHYLDRMMDDYRGERAFMAMSFPARMAHLIADLNGSGMDHSMAVFSLALCFLRLLETMPDPEQLS